MSFKLRAECQTSGISLVYCFMNFYGEKLTNFNFNYYAEWSKHTLSDGGWIGEYRFN